MRPESIQQFARLILSRTGTGAVGDYPPDADLHDLVRVNRLEPLFYLWGIQPEIWRDEYVRNVRRAEPALALGVDVVGQLEQSAIPCLPLRGPFWGMQYWGDPAARTFADLDFLVPPAQARRALKLLERSGFHLRPRGMSARFFQAIHLHYPLVHAATGIFCDLHWAVDHPFRNDRIPCETIFTESTFRDFGPYRWRVASLPHEWLLTVLHFAKELPSLAHEPDSTLWFRASLAGQLKHVLDLAVCGFPVEPGSDFEAVSRLAQEWHVQDAIGRARAAMQGFRNGAMPIVAEKLELMAPRDSFVSPSGFRRHRLNEVWTYLNGRNCWRAGGHLIRAGCVAGACLAAWKIRSLRWRGAS